MTIPTPEVRTFDDVAREMRAGIREHGEPSRQIALDLHDTVRRCSPQAQDSLHTYLDVIIARAEELDCPVGGTTASHEAWRSLRRKLAR